MSAEWAAWWSYEWWGDIGVPTIAAFGSIAVGAGATFVAFSSNRIASRIANREHDSDALQARVAFGAAVIRWSDQLMVEIRRPSTTFAGVALTVSSDRESADELKAAVDASAAAFHKESGQDLVAFVELVTTKTPDTNTPAANRERESLVAIRRAHVQSWIAHPATWKDLDNSARLSADEWVRAAAIRGEFETTDQSLVQPA